VNNEGNKVLFIINKFSGSGAGPELERMIISACKNRNREVVIEYTKAKGHAIDLAHQAVLQEQFRIVVAVGGDGTVNEVANGLLNSDVPMGILPKGSGNGLARHFGIPMNVLRSLDSLFNSQVIAMDTFRLNGKLSLNVSGIGFDGHVANLFGASGRRGLRGYTKVTLNEFVSFKEFKARITSGDQRYKRKTFIIAIANSSQYGNNARIAPAASVCDGILHICFLKKVPAYRLDFIYSFFAGKIENTTFCEIVETQKMTIEIDKPVAFHIDGEPSGLSDRFEIEILPGSLKMCVPVTSLKY
jgi:diacylglycerol kinase (ATP)